MRKKALLIEDDAFTRYTMEQIAKTLGHDLLTAASGQDGLDILKQQGSDVGVVLMDLHMPGLSGVDAAKSIRELPEGLGAEIPIIAVTADMAYFDDAVVQKIGMNGFASKPVNPGRLMSLFEKYCS